jgi:hypothetical protein
LAFVRRKKMGGRHYYQLVRNYREEGKHRQKVLCHLGVYDSVEAAIAGAKQRIAFHQDVAAAKREEADHARAELHAYGYEGLELDDRREARQDLYRRRWFRPYRSDYSHQEEWERWKEEWDADVRVAELRVAYHEALTSAAVNEERANDGRDKLTKLMECQRKYRS